MCDFGGLFSFLGRINLVSRSVLYAPKLLYDALGCSFSSKGAYKSLEIVVFICPKVKNGGAFFMFSAYWWF